MKDLRQAGSVVRRLLPINWYMEHTIKNYDGHQEVIICYSDIGKDVGCFTAAVCVLIIQDDVVAATGEGTNIALHEVDNCISMEIQGPESKERKLAVCIFHLTKELYKF